MIPVVTSCFVCEDLLFSLLKKHFFHDLKKLVTAWIQIYDLHCTNVLGVTVPKETPAGRAGPQHVVCIILALGHFYYITEMQDCTSCVLMKLAH